MQPRSAAALAAVLHTLKGVRPMPATRSLTLRNAKGRETVADMLEAVARRTGAAFERESLNPREIMVHLTLDGASCMVLLEADDARHDFFAGHWHFDHAGKGRAGRLFRDGFDGHGYKAHHKATTMTETAEDLCSAIEARLGWIADGSAFTIEA